MEGPTLYDAQLAVRVLGRGCGTECLVVFCFI